MVVRGEKVLATLVRDLNVIEVAQNDFGICDLRHRAMVGRFPRRMILFVAFLAGCRSDVTVRRNLEWAVFLQLLHR